MKTTSQHSTLLYLLLLLALLAMTGCGPSPEQIAAQTATAQTAVAANLTATATLWTPTPTATNTPTPTATATSTPTPTSTPDPTDTPTITPTSAARSTFTIQDKTISLVMPEGWQQVDDPNRLILVGPELNGMPLSITFSLDEYSMFGAPMDADSTGIAFFSAHVQDTIQGMLGSMTELSEDFLDNPQGESYFRWVMEHKTNGKEFHQAFYIFGSGQKFLTVMYGRPKSEGEEYDAMIDEAMQTLTFEQSK